MRCTECGKTFKCNQTINPSCVGMRTCICKKCYTGNNTIDTNTITTLIKCGDISLSRGVEMILEAF